MGAQRTRLRFEEIKKVVSEKQKRTVLKCYTSGVSKKTRLKKTIFKKINLFFLSFYFLLSLSFSQQDNLCIKGTLQTQTLTIKGSDTLPASPTKGEIYYKTDEDTIYFYDGSQWQKIGEGQDKTVASQIVRTQNSRYDADKTCDGTDDQQEIQQAINDLGDNKGSVYLLEGEYSITDSIKLDCKGEQAEVPWDGIDDFRKSIIGTGAGTVLKASANIDTVIKALFYYNKLWEKDSKMLITHLTIDANNKATCGIYWYGWDPRGSFSIIDTTWIENGINYGIRLLDFNTIISNNFFYNNAQQYSSGHSYPSMIWYECGGKGIISNNILNKTPNDGICVSYWWAGRGCEDLIISNNTIKDCHRFFSILINENARNVIINGNNCNNSGEIGIFYSPNHVVSANIVSLGRSIFIAGSSDSSRILLSNNMVSNSRYGIVAGIREGLVFGNIVSNPYYSGTANGGISVEGDLELVASNLIYNEKTPLGGNEYGIYINPNQRKNYFVGNFIIGPTYSGERRVYEDRTVSTFYTDKLKLTLEGKPLDISNSTYTLDMTTNPRTYFQLNPQADTTLSLQDGKSPGDLLILENTSSSYTITISESTNVELEKNTLTLGQNDTLMLLWDGTKWIQTAYSDN